MPNFERKFRKLNCIDLTNNMYIGSRKVTEIVAREVFKDESCCTFIDYQTHLKTSRNSQFL